MSIKSQAYRLKKKKFGIENKFCFFSLIKMNSKKINVK